MIFVLHKNVIHKTFMPMSAWASEVVVGEEWTWSYRQGSEKNPGTETFAVSPRAYDSEREARSAIAKARKAFGGARMAKVIPSDD